MRYSTFTKEDEKRFLSLTEGGGAATFIYSCGVAHGGKLTVYDECDREVRTIAKAGVIFVPVSFFSFIEGVTVGDGYIKCGERSVCLSDYAEHKTEKTSYVPALECARALGLCADSFFESRYIFVGGSDEIELLKSDVALADAGAYALFPEYGTFGFAPEDYKAARTKWRLSLVGSPEINDL